MTTEPDADLCPRCKGYSLLRESGEPFCAACNCNPLRRVPVQGSPFYVHPFKWPRTILEGEPGFVVGTVAFWECEAAWKVYDAKYGGQTFERLMERGGFDWRELATLLNHEPTTWLPKGIP